VVVIFDTPKRRLNYDTVGSGFVRVPYPRKYDMPPSKKIADDPEEAEIYSMSIAHQLHCLVCGLTI
jgi:hypothetical protein